MTSERFPHNVARLQAQFALTDCSIDVECIYREGDLAGVLQTSLAALLPDAPFAISEQTTEDGQFFVATLTHREQVVSEFYAATTGEYLPDDFWEKFESIPLKMDDLKQFLPINPRLLGQEAWYFCGTPENLRQARNAGLPLVLPGEDYFETDLSAYE